MKMQDVYRESVAALVLDAGLLQHSGPLDPLEVLVRVQTSDWGPPIVDIPGSSASAQGIHFQFQDTCSEEIVEVMNQRPHDSECREWRLWYHAQNHPGYMVPAFQHRKPKSVLIGSS